MSFKITTTTASILVISYCCVWTKGQEAELSTLSNDPQAPINHSGSGLSGTGSDPGRPGRSGFGEIDARLPRWPRSASGLEESRFRSATEGTRDYIRSDDNISQRFLFGHFGGNGERVSCDYNTQAGVSCSSCDQLLTCTQRGGRLKTCRGSLRYCTDGRCTFRQSDSCAAGTSTTSTTAATTVGADSTTAATQTTTGSEQ